MHKISVEITPLPLESSKTCSQYFTLMCDDHATFQLDWDDPDITEEWTLYACNEHIPNVLMWFNDRCRKGHVDSKLD